MPHLRIALIGDFDRGKHSHWASEAALFHAAQRLELGVEPRWVSTSELNAVTIPQLLHDFDGIWGAPGSPYVNMEGALRAIEFARRHDLPYLGTCAGFQYALIEFTRHVLGLADADSAENATSSENIVITPVFCPTPSRGASVPLLSGADVARPVPDTLLATLCGTEDLGGEYFCNFETNPAYIERWQAAGLQIAARGDADELRAFELPDRRFFIATLFQPQLSSSVERPHPIVLGFLQACRQKLT
jgi:CTP synthase (UTP-ammonia lyase)